MNILAFECANFSLSVAAQNCNHAKVFQEYKEVRGQDAVILPLIIECLKEVNINFNDLHFITTTLGPGSFTGVRVGLSLARGFRLALGIPIVAVNSFDWVLESISLSKIKEYNEIYIILNSQREELFVKKFNTIDSSYSDPQLLTPQEIMQLITDKPTLIIGDGAFLMEEYSHLRPSLVIDNKMPNAYNLIQIATKKYQTGEYGEDKPLYLRSPDITKR